MTCEQLHFIIFSMKYEVSTLTFFTLKFEVKSLLKFVSGQWSVHYYILYSFINHLRVQHVHEGFYWFLKYFHPSFYATRHRHLCSNSPMHLRISTPLICACSKTKSNKHKKQPSVTFKKYWKTYVYHMYLNKIEYRCKHINNTFIMESAIPRAIKEESSVMSIEHTDEHEFKTV